VQRPRLSKKERTRRKKDRQRQRDQDDDEAMDRAQRGTEERHRELVSQVEKTSDLFMATDVATDAKQLLAIIYQENSAKQSSNELMIFKNIVHFDDLDQGEAVQMITQALVVPFFEEHEIDDFLQERGTDLLQFLYFTVRETNSQKHTIIGLLVMLRQWKLDTFSKPGRVQNIIFQFTGQFESLKELDQALQSIKNKDRYYKVLRRAMIEMWLLGRYLFLAGVLSDFSSVLTELDMNARMIMYNESVDIHIALVPPARGLKREYKGIYILRAPTFSAQYNEARNRVLELLPHMKGSPAIKACVSCGRGTTLMHKGSEVPVCNAICLSIHRATNEQ